MRGRRGEGEKGRRGVPDSDWEARGCFGRDALRCVSNRSSASSSVQNEVEGVRSLKAKAKAKRQQPKALKGRNLLARGETPGLRQQPGKLKP